MPPATDTVVLLHGIIKSTIDMMPVARYLEREGYKTCNLPYNTSLGSIDDIADNVWEQMQKEGLGEKSVRVHFVAHSMGGLVADRIIRRYKPANLGNVVMWGTPLKGCEFADRLNDSNVLGGLYRWMYGESGQELQVRINDPARDKPIGYTAGMIAGTRSWNPMANWFLHDLGEHDGVVPVDSTFREGLKGRLIMPVTHMGMLFSKDVHRHTVHFLRKGAFAPS